jgi:hypothetical protein
MAEDKKKSSGNEESKPKKETTSENKSENQNWKHDVVLGSVDKTNLKKR